jgi:predicted SprT family Zn-dependent metalloprotease
VRDSITSTEYKAFQQAYDFFNRELFGDLLPPVLVTFQRHSKTLGYFSPKRFTERGASKSVHEVALNPDGFTGRTDAKILSTLVHEMAHVWQQTYGNPGRRGYHNREWATKMKEIGLHPSTTGARGGAETGEGVSHYIVAGGLYARSYAKLKSKGFELHWESVPGKRNEAKNASKTRFICPDCGQKVWAKSDASLICGACYEDDDGNPCFMLAM